LGSCMICYMYQNTTHRVMTYMISKDGAYKTYRRLLDP
jgi:hypothetical protein